MTTTYVFVVGIGVVGTSHIGPVTPTSTQSANTSSATLKVKGGQTLTTRGK